MQCNSGRDGEYSQRERVVRDRHRHVIESVICNDRLIANNEYSIIKCFIIEFNAIHYIHILCQLIVWRLTNDDESPDETDANFSIEYIGADVFNGAVCATHRALGMTVERVN